MKTKRARKAVPRPFLKWGRGRGRILKELVSCIRGAGAVHRYHDPFAGGGALYFALARDGLLPEVSSYLSDINEALMDTYLRVAEDAELIIRLLRTHERLHNKEYYYQVRAEVPANRFERAARMIYLNRTCYRGLYRQNGQGEFNVPLGSSSSPTICDADNLRAASQALKRAKIDTRHYVTVLDYTKPGDLVYLDPPFPVPGSAGGPLPSGEEPFGEKEQRQLANVFTLLDKRGAKVLATNIAAPLVEGLYLGYHVRTIGNRPTGSGEELLQTVVITNYEW